MDPFIKIQLFHKFRFIILVLLIVIKSTERTRSAVVHQMVLRLKHPKAFKKRLLRGGKSPKGSRQKIFRNFAKDLKPQEEFSTAKYY